MQLSHREGAEVAATAVVEPPALIRILLVGDQPILREGLTTLFDREAGFRVVGSAVEPDETIKSIRDRAPDILLVSLTGRPLARMLYTLHVLMVAGNRGRTIVLTAAVPKMQLAAWHQVGVAGILPIDTSPPVMFESVRSVVDGLCWVGQKPVADLRDAIEPRSSMPSADARDLTPRELEIVGAIRRGATNREISRELGIAADTVKHSVACICRKVGVFTRLQLTVLVTNRECLGQQDAQTPNTPNVA